MFVCLIFVGEPTHENLSPTKISLSTVFQSQEETECRKQRKNEELE